MFGFKAIRSVVDGVRDTGGNVAIVASLAMVPLCIATLGAVDLARAVAAKVQLQNALDAAALGAARMVGTSEVDLQSVGHRLLQQGLARGTDMELESSSFAFDDDGKVLASARANVEPYVAGFLGIDELDISTSTEVVRAGFHLEIALVLDNTGSMLSNNKLTHLQEAAELFVDEMEQAAEENVEPDSIRISLVPFSHTVRVSPSVYRYSSWVDQNGASPINNEIFTTSSGTQFANRFTLFSQLGTSWRGCLEMRQSPYDVQDTAPTTATPATLYTPYFWPDEPDVRTVYYYDDYNNNYVGDGTNSSSWRVRQGSVTKYRSVSGLGTSRGPNKGCSIQPLMRLTTNFDNVRDGIRNMTASGNTNIPIGLMWGWNTLSPRAPFADGVAYLTDKHKKIVVLMTDGDNTLSNVDTPNGSDYAGAAYVRQRRIIGANGVAINEGDSNAARTAGLDHRLALLCANMKAPSSDIEIYTIRVEVSGGSSTVLRNCATTADHYYDVSDASQLTTVFQNIAGQIAALHLSK
jgi:Flp pilus assembly protein TadG